MSALFTPEQARFISGYRTAPPVQPMSVNPRSSRPVTPQPQTPIPATPDPGRHTSAAARDAFGLAQISKQAQAVLEVIRIAHKHGVADLTGREVRDWWQKVHVGKDIDTSTLSPRIGELISAGLLERLPKRFCTITNIQAGPVRAVAQQTRLAR